MLNSIIAFLHILSLSAQPSRPEQVRVSALEGIPVLFGGRIKPFDTFARDIVLQVTGKRKWLGWQPMETLLSWSINPETWKDEKFIQIPQYDIKKRLLLDESRRHFSPRELLGNTVLMQYQGNKDVAPVFDRLNVFFSFISGEILKIAFDVNQSGHRKTETLKALLEAAARNEDKLFSNKASELRTENFSLLGNEADEARVRIDRELLLNKSRPFFWAWVFFLLATCFLVFQIVLERKSITGGIGTILAGLSTGLLIYGFTLRCLIAGRPPVTNMYESIIWVASGVILFGWILAFVYRATSRKYWILAIASAFTTLTLIAADAAPSVMDPSIHPLVPVLRSNLWLTIHVLVITLSYAAYALSFGTSNITLFLFMKKSQTPDKDQVLFLNKITYRAIQIGTVLLAAGTILGGVWADYSWGRFWGWDPKEVWALIALLGYLAIIHVRVAGHFSQFSFPAWTVCAFLLVIMAWYGVNFVLGVGLHSYGFSTGGQGVVGTFILIQSAFLGISLFLRNRSFANTKLRPSDPNTG